MIIKKSGVSELQNGTPDGIQTITGLRISAVDGTAFLDNCAELQKYAGRMIRIYDSGSRYLEGWIKANGSGETLVDKINPINLTSGWSVNAATIVDADTFTTSFPNCFVYRADLISRGGLFLGSFSATTSAGSVKVTAQGGEPFWNNGSLNSYITIPQNKNNDQIWIINTLPSTIDITTCLLQQVLTPSASGLTIVSAQGGATYNFTTKTASFVYNEASYRYKIF